MKKQLIEELKEAAEAYYHGSTPIMTDEEYDDKLEYLRSIVSDEELDENEDLRSLFISPSAGTVPARNLVEHRSPMLSLAKAKNEDELKRYYERMEEAGANGYTLQAKLDGLAMSVIYEDGVLTQIATRGDGTRGEVMTYLKDSDELFIEHLPNKLTEDNSNGIVELRGELFATHSQFEEFNKARKAAQGEDFANSRNAVAGIVKKAEAGLGYDAEITFITYSAFINNVPVMTNVLENEDILDAREITLKEVSEVYDNVLEVVDANDFVELHNAVNIFGTLRDDFDIPTDGVVIKPKNEVQMLQAMGNTSHHPVAFMAYKYPGVKVATVVEEITVTVGKTGSLTPQARVKPVEVDGSTLENFTCHNYNWLYNMGIREGATVFVTKANDVIPAIASVIDEGPNDMPEIPKACPVCGSELKHDGDEHPSKNIYCPNVECPSRVEFYIRSILGRTFLHIDGIGDVVLEALIEAGKLNSIVDLFSLEVDDMKDLVIGETSTGNPRKLGKTRATKIKQSIDHAKAKTPDFRLLGSLGIDGVGPNSAKTLIEHFGSLMNVLKADRSQLAEVPGFGDIKVDNVLSHQSRLLEIMEDLTNLGVKINEQAPKGEVKGTFSVSGSVEGFPNRASFVEHMESLGWEFHKSPKKDTDVLFADPNSNSSKVKKARENGTKITQNINDL